MPASPRAKRSWLIGPAAAVLLALGSFASALAAPPATAADHASLSLIDCAYGDALTPLLFQVVGLGFQPGEAVRIEATVWPAGGRPFTLAPLTTTADPDGNVAAVLLGPGLGQPADGFIVRAVGAPHRASIIDLVTGGASVTSPPPKGTVSYVG